MPSKLIKDMAGLRFTRVVVLNRTASDRNGNARWACLCDCGTQFETHGFNLRNGSTKSCGCLTTEQLIERETRHGRSGTPEYLSWAGMFQRCNNANNVRYHRYGARGISVCERWKDFAIFFADMGERPSSAHTLERIDGNGNYEPGNCKWATKADQNRNKCDNRYIEYKGQRLTVMDASKLAGLSFGGLKFRLNQGWDIDRAMETPPKKLAVHDIMRARKALKQ